MADFNVSKVVRDGLLRTQTGTPYYASPEVWQDKPYNFKSDVWSLGCVMYEVAASRVPFKASDMKGLYKKVCVAAYAPLPSRYSQQLRDVIGKMMTVDPCKRPTCEELLVSPPMMSKIRELSERDKNVVQAMQGFFDLSASGNHINSVEDDTRELLESIRLPKVLTQLEDRLPKPQYNRRDFS